MHNSGDEPVCLRKPVTSNLSRKMKAIPSTPTAVHRPRGVKRIPSIESNRKRVLGQFLTPDSIALFMAGLFESYPAEIRLLDAGAGDGALTSAFVNQACASKYRPMRIIVTAFEIDRSITARLKRTLEACETECRRQGIVFSAQVENRDFVEVAVSLNGTGLFGESSTSFDA